MAQTRKAEGKMNPAKKDGGSKSTSAQNAPAEGTVDKVNGITRVNR